MNGNSPTEPGEGASPFTVERIYKRDWARVRSIYMEGISTGFATFETAVPTWDDWSAEHPFETRFVARSEEDVIGWAALKPVSSRRVYSGVGEVTTYVGEAWRGRGVGRALLNTVIEASGKEGYWTLQAAIFPANAASIALHERLGFREVGVRERLGQIDGQWRDVLLLERRSSVVGV